MKDFKLEIIDDGKVIEKTTAKSFLKENEDLEESDLKGLRKKGDRITVGGGAAAEFTLHRTSARRGAGSPKRRASGSGREILVEGDHVRVMYDKGDLVIQEMPKSRGKVRRTVFHLEMYYKRYANAMGGSLALEPRHVLKTLRLSSGASYQQALNECEGCLSKRAALGIKDKRNQTPQHVLDTLSKMVKKPRDFFQTKEVSYLSVEPKDYKPIKFTGKGFKGSCEWKSFDVELEWDGFTGGGKRAYYSSKSDAAARKLFKILKPDPSVTNQMDHNDLKKLFDKARIKYNFQAY